MRSVSKKQVVDVFCEPDGPVQILMKLPQNGSMKQFDRPRDQSLQKTLQRISLTLKKGPKKKGRGKSRPWEDGAKAGAERAAESAPEINCLLDEMGHEIEDLPLADAFTSARAPSLLKLSWALRDLVLSIWVWPYIVNAFKCITLTQGLLG